jgi:hypothetical protein
MLDLILSHLSPNHLFSSRFKFTIIFVSLHMCPIYSMVNFKKIYMDRVGQGPTQPASPPRPTLTLTDLARFSGFFFCGFGLDFIQPVWGGEGCRF